LRELVKSVEDNDPMAATLNSACEKISGVVANINESKKKVENMRATAQLAENIDGMPQGLCLFVVCLFLFVCLFCLFCLFVCLFVFVCLFFQSMFVYF